MSNFISQLNNIISKSSARFVIVTDNNVAKLHLEKIKLLIKKFKIRVIILTPGEKAKSRKIKAQIETILLEEKYDRNTVLVAFGGGVIGDLTGFVAATYMRGIEYINIPTTLLAMVDSSIGGKVAINTPQGKNLIGAYWPAKQIVLDTQLLSTLSEAQLINGAIEALKMFLTCDKKAVTKFEAMLPQILNAQIDAMQWLIRVSNKIKMRIVKQDERENEMRKILNFGHTVGHAIELGSNYKMLHGVAVGYGILIESKIAQFKGYLNEQDYQTIKNILLKLKLKPEILHKFDINKLIINMQHDKKNQAGKLHCVLLNGLGGIATVKNQVTHEVDIKTLKQAIIKVGN